MTPAFRKLSSRRRFSSVSKSYTVVSLNISGSGLNVTRVPVTLGSTVPMHFSGPSGSPRRKVCSYSRPSRRTLTVSHSEQALTTDAPTPCRPPATL